MNKHLAFAGILGTAVLASHALADDAPATQPVQREKRVMIIRKDMGDADGGTINVNGGNVIYQAFPLKTEKGAWLGVTTSRAPEAMLQQLKIKNGLVVGEVKPDSPAAAAGLKSNDLIEKLDDQLLINPAQMEGLIRLHKADDTVSLTILHAGDRSTVTAKLVEHDVPVLADGDGPITIRGFGALPAVPVIPGDGNGPLHVKVNGNGTGTVTVRSSANGHTSFQSMLNDGKHELTLSGEGDSKILTIKDHDGNQVFQGPVDTDEQQAKIPADLLPKFKEMQKMQNMTDDVAKPVEPKADGF